MKRFLITILVLISSSLVFAEGFSIPNLELTKLLSFKDQEFHDAVTSKFCEYKKIESRIGYQLKSEVMVGALSFNLKNLPAQIDYAWKDSVNLSIGLYLGYNFKSKDLDYGLGAVILSIKLN
jgi:hypothetical protein